MMGEMGQIGAPRLHGVDKSQSVIDAEMGEMGLAPESVDDKSVDPFEPLDCRLQNRACVGDIGKRAYAVAENVKLAVEHRQRNRLKPRRAEYAVILDLAQLKTRRARIGMRPESIRNTRPEVADDVGAGIDGEWLVAGAPVGVGAEVVDAAEMVILELV